ncbi:hypothetical protein HKD37_15G044076 [Glycine soja]
MIMVCTRFDVFFLLGLLGRYQSNSRNDTKKMTRPLRIIYDNGVVVLYTKNNKTSSDFKFMELNLLTMRDLYKDYAIVVSHVGTNSLLTDPLTKGLRLVILKRQIDNMSIVNSFNLIMLG